MSSVRDDFLDAVAEELAKRCRAANTSAVRIGCIGCALSEYCGGEDSPERWRDTIEDYLDGWAEDDEEDADE